MTRILGLSAYYHDSAAALLEDGELVAAAQEERFTRQKHEARFPAAAARYCLAGTSLDEVDYVVFYDKPLLKFERMLETHLAYAPNGFNRFRQAMPVWLKEKLWLKKMLRQELSQLSGGDAIPRLLFTQHHQAHAGSAFYCSPFQQSAVLCIDGVGEWATTSAWSGTPDNLKPLWQIDFPHSIGLLYSAFTYYCGFSVNSGEYKLMGLAPYGKPRFVELIKSELISIDPDGTYALNLDYFDYCVGERMISEKFRALFGAPERLPETEITSLYRDLAASIQAITEEVVVKLASSLRRETGHTNLCLAGGVALNCVANGVLRRTGMFEHIWVQPAAGDAGCAIGAAFNVWHEHLGNPKSDTGQDRMKGCLLGPAYDNSIIESELIKAGAKYQKMETQHLLRSTASMLANGNIVGWYQGRMEFGPRALGARSILADARNPNMQQTLNLRIKFRESFRPFAPAVLREHLAKYFVSDQNSPYMMFVDYLVPELRLTPDSKRDGLDRVNEVRSALPGITHLDYSARVQTVGQDDKDPFYQLLLAFQQQTGCAVLINTSFNVRGEPIVQSPLDALRCFHATEMDALVIGSFILHKKDQTTLSIPELQIPAPVMTNAALKKFSRSLAILLSGFALTVVWVNQLPISPWLVLPFLVLFIWGEIIPGHMRAIHRGWHQLGVGLARITSPVIFSLVFFFIITPLGLIQRLVRRSKIHREYKPDRRSTTSNPGFEYPF